MGEIAGNVVIIGTGPAGISAALYSVRSGIETTVIGKGPGALKKAEKIENYYGFPEPVTGRQLIENGMAQAKRLGAKIVADEAVGLEYADKLTVKTATGEYAADCVILATGSPRRAPNIKGLAEYEGRGVSYCAVCDAFLYRGREVAVLGGGAYAQHEMEELLPLAKHVTLLTHGAEPEFDPPPEVNVRTPKLLRLRGGDTLTGAELATGQTEPFQGLFVALGSASAGDLAQKLGLQLQRNAIPVDSRQETQLPGLFAAGDCTGAFAQVAFAVAEGARAGMGMIQYLRR